MDSAHIGVGSLSVSDNGSAGTAMSKIQAAITSVSEQRSSLGAIQNRLEHTINNLNTTSENTSSAESRIRDTDMASEMVEYSKNNILQQAGQSMLAQANQQTQGILSLLQQ
jgi:flagellin